jgi:hypothetical protein
MDERSSCVDEMMGHIGALDIKRGDLVIVKQFDQDSKKFIDSPGIIISLREGEPQQTWFPDVDVHLFNCDQIVKCGLLQIKEIISAA